MLRLMLEAMEKYVRYAMIDVNSAIHESQIKLSTGHADKYKYIQDNDGAKIISAQNGDMMIFCFAIGFHRSYKVPIKSGKPFVNLTSISTGTRRIVAELVLHRHGEQINAPAELWKLVEEYTEEGLEILYDSMLKSGGRIIIDDICGEMVNLNIQ